MKRLSIIVPMYNVEPYVERCLRSLEDQDIPKTDYEIVCINDGSPDNSREVVLKMQNEFDNIILIDQENQGVSRARNNGIDKAEGKYILFIDPDDFVVSNTFASELAYIECNKAQVSFSGFRFYDLEGNIKNELDYSELKNKVFKGIDAYFLARRQRETDPDRICGVLFDKSFLNFHGFRYIDNVPYLEDGEFIARILCFSERVVFNNEVFYLRTTRLGSATNSKLFLSEVAIKGFLMSAGNLVHLKKRKDLSVEQINFLNQPIAKFVLLPIIASSSFSTFWNYRKVKREILSRNMGCLDLNGCDKIYTRFGMIFNKSIDLFYVYWLSRRILIVLKNKLTIKRFFILHTIYDYLNLYEKYIIR